MLRTRYASLHRVAITVCYYGTSPALCDQWRRYHIPVEHYGMCHPQVFHIYVFPKLSHFHKTIHQSMSIVIQILSQKNHWKSGTLLYTHLTGLVSGLGAKSSGKPQKERLTYLLTLYFFYFWLFNYRHSALWLYCSNLYYAIVCM